MYGDSEIRCPSRRDSSTLSNDKCSRIASANDKSSNPRTSKPRVKRELPRKENSKKKRKLLAKESINQENKPKTRVVCIHVLDPDATDSSNEEEDEEVSSKRKVIHKIQIPYNNHLHESQRREPLSIKRGGRRNNSKKAKEHEKKNGGLSSCSSCTSFEGVHGGHEELESLVRPGVLYDIPGPIPDLESLLKDARSFLFNFFEGVPECD